MELYVSKNYQSSNLTQNPTLDQFIDLTQIIGTTEESHWPAILAEKPEDWFTKKAQVEEEAERKRLTDLKAAEEKQIKKADNKDLEEAGEDLSLWKSVEASD